MHANNESLFDSKSAIKALEDQHTAELKLMQADITQAEIAKSSVTKKLIDLEQRYDALKLFNQPDNSKYKNAYKQQKEENEKNQALITQLNDKFEAQTELIASSQAREQEYVRRLHEFNNVSEQLAHNERVTNELTQEHTKQQLLITQLQQAATHEPVNSRNKRPRTTSEQTPSE